MTATLQKTQVDLSGLMRVLSEALYSTPFVVIRELVQNCHDSCTRRQLEYGRVFEPKIEVKTHAQTLIFTDNGAGLTEAEIHSYLATVGTGYTRKLRDQAREQSESAITSERPGEDYSDALIGYFGLGFLSAFAVSERVEVWTCSAASPDIAHRFTSRTGETYSVEKAATRAIGTEVRLTLRDDRPELMDATAVFAWLQRYCSLLKFPVHFNGAAAINADVAPWRQDQMLSALRQKTLSLQFAKRFEDTFEPITTIAIASPDQRFQGLLWIQDSGTFGNSDNRNLAVFVRGMLIGTDERELLPRWAGFVGGVIESTVLTPTASRETLKKDQHYQDAAEFIRDCLVQGLANIASSDKASWKQILLRHNQALLGSALVDTRLFKLLGDEVTLPSTEGDCTVPELLKRGEGSLYVTLEQQVGLESVLLRALKVPIVLGTRYAAASFCRRYVESVGGKLVMLGTREGDQRMFLASTLSPQQGELLQQWFVAPDREVLVRTFEPAFLPFALVANRDEELKRELEDDAANRRISQAVLGLARIYTQKTQADALARLYINAANPVVQALFDLSQAERERALTLLQPILMLVSDSKVRADMAPTMLAFNTALLASLAGRDK
jgi:molecular chaperone HtpG